MKSVAGYILAKLSVIGRRGVTAIEYGLLAALIAVGTVGAVKLVGTKLANTFNTIGNNLK